MTDGLTGIVLAAGAGTRMGMPKALMRTRDGTPWLEVAAGVLSGAGCEAVIAVLGASADEAAPLLPGGVETLVTDAWEDGVSASLATGLDHAARSSAQAALITLVDLPDMRLEAALRVRAAAQAPLSSSLAQAHYGDTPGHPVLIGRDHWDALHEHLGGDTGAREYLRAHGAQAVECGDLGGGEDVDHPQR